MWTHLTQLVTLTAARHISVDGLALHPRPVAALGVRPPVAQMSMRPMAAAPVLKETRNIKKTAGGTWKP